MNLYNKSDIPEHLQQYFEPAEIGLEETPEQYVHKLVEVFREVKRVLKDDGTLWLNLGDSYAGGNAKCGTEGEKQRTNKGGSWIENDRLATIKNKLPGLKTKDLIGIPWMVAFALRADGWYLRQDIIWCLSGGTWLYVRSQKGDMPMMVRDIARLNPKTVQLWNGEKWTGLLGMNKNKRIGDEQELVLRSGERISCTPTHRFPTLNGLKCAADIRIGDVLKSCHLPEPDITKDCAIDEDAAWLAGLYIAEGSKSGDTIQIAGHIKEIDRWNNIQRIAMKFGGIATRTIDGNKMDIRVYGRVLNAIIDELVSGKTAKNKGFAPVVWRYSNKFIESMLSGYLSGDGHKEGNRWRIGFCRNYNLERDLRTVCARLGYKITLNLATSECNGKQYPSFRGEIRMIRSGHFNEKEGNEVVSIRKARCREVWDLGVSDDPHLFSLASGVLTHNSKPNPMPESVTDRCTKSHEYIFLLSKSQKYYYDSDSIREPHKRLWDESNGGNMADIGHKKGMKIEMKNTHPKGYPMPNELGANKRSVWTVTTKPFSEAHFATFPEDLIVDCIKAGCPENGIVLDPFMGAGTTALVAKKLNRNYIGFELNREYIKIAERRIHTQIGLFINV